MSIKQLGRVEGYPATFTIRQEQIDITSDRPTLDPKWRYTDEQGHDHYYDHGYPTLDYIIDEQHWCDGTEGIYNHDPHWAVDEAHYECLQCREVIQPGTIPAFTPQFIPGVISLEATVEGDAGEHFEYELDGERFQFDRVALDLGRDGARSEYVGYKRYET